MAGPRFIVNKLLNILVGNGRSFENNWIALKKVERLPENLLNTTQNFSLKLTLGLLSIGSPIRESNRDRLL